MLTKSSWTPTNAPITYDRELFIYDAGPYIGFLLDNEWKCWRVIKRDRVDHTVEEILEEMPLDWVPYDIASKEVYKCTGSFSARSITIPGWTISFDTV